MEQNKEQRPIELPVNRDRNNASFRNGKKQRTPISATRPDLDDRGATLIQIELANWADIDSETRIEQLKTLDDRYHGIIDELYGSANLCVDRHQEFSRSHGRWRRILIIGTGAIALLNMGAVNQAKWLADHPHIFPIAAAVCAIVLAILANLESFSNSLEKAQAYRESRELFLDVAREFDRRWDVYVRPYAETPEACSNAAELYRQVVVRDRELRAKFKRDDKDGIEIVQTHAMTELQATTDFAGLADGVQSGQSYSGVIPPIQAIIEGAEYKQNTAGIKKPSFILRAYIPPFIRPIG